MFPGALDKKYILGNREFTVKVSSSLFRQKCDKLRQFILKTSRELNESHRVINVQKWAQDVTAVWRAVLKTTDDLLVLQDLQQINDNRNVQIALDQFLQVMSKRYSNKNSRQNDELNPLL